MLRHLHLPTLFYPATQEQAVFAATGPQPRFLLDSEHFTVMLVGLEANQQVPVHADATVLYHFLVGQGVMTVNGQTYPVVPGATVIALAGAERGVRAATQLIFLAAKSQTTEYDSSTNRQTI